MGWYILNKDMGYASFENGACIIINGGGGGEAPELLQCFLPGTGDTPGRGTSYLQKFLSSRKKTPEEMQA